MRERNENPGRRDVERRTRRHLARQGDQRDVLTVVDITPTLGSVEVTAAPNARNGKLDRDMAVGGNAQHDTAARSDADNELEEQEDVSYEAVCHGLSL